MKERSKKIDQQLSETSPEVQAQSNFMQCFWSQVKVLVPHATPFWVISITGASFIYLVHQLIMESKFWTSWILMVIILVIAMVTFTKKLMSVLWTHVIFIDMPDPDNYAAVLLRACQNKGTNDWLRVAGKWVLQRMGFPLCPLYIVCGGRRVNLGLAHKNTNNKFFDQSSMSWLKWDFHQHIGTLTADEAIVNDPKTIQDSALVLKKNMFDLDCILHNAGYSDYVLVKGNIAKQIPLSYSHHADEWRFYNNVEKHWVSTDEYDQWSDQRCNESDITQNFEQRRKLARLFIDRLSGVSDFESSSIGSHWLTLDQLHTLLCNYYSAINITMAGPATDLAYLVDKSSCWTENVSKICAMWAVCELGQNTGRMNVCGMNFNKAADLQDAQYMTPKHFPNALFSFLPTETCKLTPQFKVTHSMAARIDVLQCVADKIALWTHIKDGQAEPLFDHFICESPDITAALHKMGLIKVYVTPNTNEGYMILSPSPDKTSFRAWVNPKEMFRNFTWGKNKISFNGTHWSYAKVVV